MPGCQFENFDITISGEQPPYQVAATYQHLTAHGLFYQDATQSLWREYLRRLGDVTAVPGEDLITAAGGQLFDELMQEEIRDLWISARYDLDRSSEGGLRLRLFLHSPAVASLPWESLYDRRRRQAFGANDRIALVRVKNLISYIGHSRSIAAELPVKIMLAVAEDPGGNLDVKQEIDGIGHTLSSLTPDKITLVTREGRFSIHDLRQTLLTEEPDILHLISHGQPDGLLLWQGNAPQMVPASSFQATLEQAQSVKLAFLNACLAGQPASEAPFASLAQRLLQAGLPAVIAMQFEIWDGAAIQFSRFLYEALVTEPCAGAIDLAVGHARSNLYISDPNRIDYATPVLWLNAADGVIFRLPEHPATRPVQPTQAATHPLADSVLAPTPAEMDLEALEAWFEAVPRWDRNKVADPNAKILLNSRQRNLDRADDLLKELRRLDREQQAGLVRKAPIEAALQEFEIQRREVERLTQILLDNLG